ncbi:MAG: glycine oxidase ThiO [Solirubrobacteraceae bacterium]
MALYSGSDGATEVVVVGGGIIGLAVAWRARREGLSVHLIERDHIGAGASSVAAGMLAPVAEVELGDHGRAAIELGMRSAAMWPEYVARLEEAGGEAVGLRPSGLLMVARDEDEARELDRQASVRASLGLKALRLRGSEAREREPALAPTVRLALEAPDDRSVDPRRVLAALRGACVRDGVVLEEGAAVESLVFDRHPAGSSRVAGVRMRGGAERRAQHVVLACGAWSGAPLGLPAGAEVPVRPVKGQTVRLRDPAGAGLLRGPVRCPGAYLVPRDDGSLVLGASMEERGFELEATAGVVRDLLDEACELVPGVAELQLDEIAVGLRPGSPDNLPLIGRGACDGLVWATGHFRNGILMAPLTGELLVEVLAVGGGEPLRAQGGERLLALCDPLRVEREPGDLRAEPPGVRHAPRAGPA